MEKDLNKMTTAILRNVELEVKKLNKDEREYYFNDLIGKLKNSKKIMEKNKK